MWQNDSKWLVFWTAKKEMFLILLSEIDPYTLKIGDLSGDLAVLPLFKVPLLQHILEHIMPYEHLQWLSCFIYIAMEASLFICYTLQFCDA